MLFWENQKVIHTFYIQCTKPVCAAYGLTQMEFDILMFLHNNPQHDTASDIVKLRMLTKSHVSSALKSLENKRYITKSYQNGNRKTVHLAITEAAADILNDGKTAQMKFAQQLFRGFSNEEFEFSKALFSRMYTNARDNIHPEV